MRALDKTNIPVHAGLARGLTRENISAADIHGKSGLDGTNLLPALQPEDKPSGKKAVLAMAEEVLARPKGEVILVAIGSMTNIAILVSLYPEVIDWIKGLVIMGGALTVGNVTSVAEFNIWVALHEAIANRESDPEAARILFSLPALGEKTVMVPLELTHSALLTEEIESRILTPKPTKFRRMWAELGRFFADTYETVFGITSGPPLHDVCAVHIASLIGRGVKSAKNGRWYGRKMHCHVETGDGRTRGQTVCHMRNYSKAQGKITVASTINVISIFARF